MAISGLTRIAFIHTFDDQRPQAAIGFHYPAFCLFHRHCYWVCPSFNQKIAIIKKALHLHAGLYFVFPPHAKPGFKDVPSLIIMGESTNAAVLQVSRYGHTPYSGMLLLVLIQGSGNACLSYHFQKNSDRLCFFQWNKPVWITTAFESKSCQNQLNRRIYVFSLLFNQLSKNMLQVWLRLKIIQ
jgi:hypothetical protein